MTAADKCHELAVRLTKISGETLPEDVRKAVDYLSQSTSNIINVFFS